MRPDDISVGSTRRFPPKTFGLSCFAMSMWLFTPMMNQWGWEQMLLPFACRGLATPFVMASTVTLALGGLPADRLKSASGLYSLMRSLGGAIGIAVCGAMLNDRTNLHFLRIAEHLNATNKYATDRMAARHGGPLRAGLQRFDVRPGRGTLWLLVYREAQVQAFAEAYLAIAVCLALSAAMVPLMRMREPVSYASRRSRRSHGEAGPLLLERGLQSPGPA